MNPGQKKTELYSLWLMPAGRVASELQTLITDLSAKHKTPIFQPHVTLIGSLNLTEADAVSKTTILARKVAPFVVRLSEVACLDQYFRCVFIKAMKTECLMNANSIARLLFGLQNGEEYMPHLSLVYGDLTRRMKQDIIKEIGNTIYIAFPVEEIYLYYTGGQPKKWRCVSITSCSS
jgi:2'-5' RNA ligase